MKAVVVGDIHAKDSGKRVNGLPESVYYAKLNLNKACQIALEKKCDYLILLGDIFDNKKFIEQEVYTNIVDCITTISEKMPIIIVVGNHDYIMVGRQISWLYKINNNRITVTKENDVLEIEDCMFVGHHDKETLQKLIFENVVNYRYIFSHFGLDEGVLSNNYRVKGEFSLRDFDNYTDEKLFILGHYHKPQELANKKNKFIYLGSINANKIDEVFDDKRMMYIDTSENYYEFIPAEQSKWIKIEVDEDTNIQELLSYCSSVLQDNNKVYIISKVIPDKRLSEFVSNNRYSAYLKVDVAKKASDELNNVSDNVDDIREVNIEQLIKKYCILNDCYNDEVFDELIKLARG